ncbi:MAG: SRPBCC family protein [Pseudomonadota bacterium]
MTQPIDKRIDIAVPQDRVFAALTSSEEIPQYFPLSRVEADWAVGGGIKLFGEADGTPFVDHGVIEILTPPTVFQYRYWSDNHGTARQADNEVTIRYETSDRQGKTRLTVTQSNLPSLELRQMMEQQVWDFLLGALKQYLEG